MLLFGRVCRWSFDLCRDLRNVWRTIKAADVLLRELRAMPGDRLRRMPLNKPVRLSLGSAAYHCDAVCKLSLTPPFKAGQIDVSNYLA